MRVMHPRAGGNVHRVYFFDQFGKILGFKRQIEFLLHKLAVFRTYPRYFAPVDVSAFVDYLFHDRRFADDAYSDLSFFAPYFTARNAFRPRQIHHFAVCAEIIELTFPIRPYGKNVYSVFAYVVDFLTFVFFYDHFVRKPRLPDGFNPVGHALVNVDFASAPVEIVTRHADYQIVPEPFRPFK